MVKIADENHNIELDQEEVKANNPSLSSSDTQDTWRTFFADFAFLFRNTLFLKDTIAVSIFALFNTLCAYFLGDFLNKGNPVGIAITLVAVALLTILSVIQMRRIINGALAIFKAIPFAFCFALLVMIIVVSNLLSAIVLLVFSLSTLNQGFMGGSLLSMILIVIVYCFYAYWIFLWKRIKWRKGK